jgi:glycine/D-amino acid oxidase-like deaminating enzyme
MDYGADRFYHELAETALEGWDRWNRTWPHPPYHEDGFLLLSRGPMRPGGFEFESWRLLRERGYAPRRVGEEVLRRDHPAWDPSESVDGYFNERAGWAESGAVVSGLLARCAEAGVRLVSEGVLPLDPGQSRVGSLTTRGGGEGFDVVVVAAGAWTPTLVPWTREILWTVAQPVLHLGVDDPTPFQPPAFPPWAADIAGSGWYGFPALSDGRLKIGHHGPGRRVDPDDRGEVGEDHVRRCRRFLAGAMPALADAPVVGRRVCLYCDSFDGDFLIAPDPDHPGLVVAAGGSGHAFKFAPLLGSLVADAVEGEDNPWAQRFRWRRAGRTRTEDARFTG